MPAGAQQRRHRGDDALHNRRQAVGELDRVHLGQRLHERRERLAAGLDQHRLQQVRQVRLGRVGVSARRNAREADRLTRTRAGLLALQRFRRLMLRFVLLLLRLRLGQPRGVVGQRRRQRRRLRRRLRRGLRAATLTATAVGNADRRRLVELARRGQVPAQHAVDVVLQHDGGAVRPRRSGAPFAQRRRHPAPRPLPDVRGRSARDRETGVVIAAAHQAVAPLQVEHRGARMTLGVRGHHRGREPGQNLPQALFVNDVTRSVANLEIAKHQQAAFEVGRLQAAVHLREGVTEEEFNTLVVKIGHQFIHIAPQQLDLAVLRFGDVENDGVDDATILGKARRHLFADERVGAQRHQFERAVDRVVIRQRHQVHSP